MLKNWLSVSFIILLSLFTTQDTFARKFYVSNTGSDANSFSAAQNSSTPWATLSKVSSSMSSFTSGDSILFKKGDKFGGSINIQSKTGLYFGSYGSGAKPLFWGTGSTISALFRVRTCTSMVFHGLRISDTTISLTDRTVQAKIQKAFVIEASSTNVTVRAIDMERIGYGVYMTRTSPGQTVDSCDVGNLRMIRNTPTSVNPDDDYGGVPVQVSGRNNTITNNYFHDCYSQSFDYGRDGGGIEFFEEGDTIQNNIIAYNTFYDGNGTFEFGSSNDGVANNPIMNNKIYYNKIINNNTVVYINNNGQYKTRVRNLQFYNNVIVQTLPNNNPVGSSGIMFTMATSDTATGILVLKNNIIQLSSGLPVTRSGQFTGPNLTHTNNLYKLSNGSVTNFTLGSGEISTSAAIWIDAANVNPISWNFNLINTSPAINAGVAISGLTRDFNNQVVSNPPDMGILEYAVVTPTACTFVYTDWTTCLNGVQSRTYTASPNGCSGTPKADSLFRSCSLPCTFTYSAWSTCLDSFQTRTFTTSPANCSGVPVSDSIRRRCNSLPDSCAINYTFTTTRSSCVGKANGSITVTNITCGAAPYTLTLTRYLNPSTITRVISSTTTTFSNLFSGSYGLTITDSRGRTVFKSISFNSKSSRTFCR
jgi:hypothetical protein